MTRTLLLAQGKPSEVNQLVREVLQAKGALLDEQTHARTVFEGLGGAGRFRRGGYVGAYQPVGEQGVEVLLQVWSSAARRILWGSVALELLLVLGLLAASPASAVFYVAALVLWTWLGLAVLLYVLTLRGSEALEQELHAALLGRFRAAGLQVLDEEQQLEQRIRERLEGEAQERELAAIRAAEPPRPRFAPKPRRGKEAPEKRPRFGLGVGKR